MAYPLAYTPEPKKPSGGPRAGTKRLYAFCIDTFDTAVYPPDDIKGLGIYNPRDVCGNVWDSKKPNGGWKCAGSQHARGAAGDCGVPVNRKVWPDGHPEGWRLARWLVKHHVALGIQEVIFAGWRWTNQTQEWRKYSGRSDHFDHVHWAQNDAAADGLTDAQILEVWQEDDMPSIDEIKQGVRDVLNEGGVALGLLTAQQGWPESVNLGRAAVNKLDVLLAAVGKLKSPDVDEDELAEALVEAVAGLEDRTARKVLDGLRDRLAA